MDRRLKKKSVYNPSKKGKKVHGSDDESIILLSDEECLLKKKKGKLVTKLPTAGSSTKEGTSNSGEDVCE
jgi:hypothetical protein